MLAAKRILVVDDDPGILELLEETLTDAGYDIQVASEGRTMVEMARRSPPDLILLDLMMPELNGWEVIRELQSDPVLQSIPVLLLSAIQGLPGAAGALEVRGYVSKPFNLEDLLDRVSALVGQS